MIPLELPQEAPQGRVRGGFSWEIGRAACVKEFERVLEQRGQLVFDLEVGLVWVTLPGQCPSESMSVKEHPVEQPDRLETESNH